MPGPSTNRSTVPRRNGEPDQGMPARSVGRPHLDSDNGRQPAAAVVLVVRLRAARGPCAGSVCRTPSWRRRPAAPSARNCSNSAPASPSPSVASRSPSPRPARTRPTSLCPRPAARTALSFTADDGRRHRTETCARGDSPSRNLSTTPRTREAASPPPTPLPQNRLIPPHSARKTSFTRQPVRNAG